MGPEGFELEVAALQRQTGVLANKLSQGIEQIALAEPLGRVELSGKGLGRLRQRNQTGARPLRQALEQRQQLLLEQAGHQPLQALRRNLVERGQRREHSDTVTRTARVEGVVELQFQRAEFEPVGEGLGGDARRLVPHELVALQEQQLGVGAGRVAIPAVEAGAAVHLGRYLLVVEGVDQFLIHQHVEPPRLVFEPFDIGNQRPVVLKERPTAVPLARHQGLAQKDLARLHRVEAAEVHPALVVDHQAVQRGPLESRDLRRFLFPMRIEPTGLEQVRAHTLQPLRLDARHAAGVEPGRFHQLGRHDPAPGLAPQRRRRMDGKAYAPRAEVLGIVFALVADVAQQTAQQRAMNLLIRGLSRIEPPALLGHQGVELAVHVVPLAQTQRRQVLGAQLAPEFALRFFVSDGGVVVRPELEPAEKLGALVAEFAVGLVGRLLRLGGSFARVLHRQRGGDDEHLVQRFAVASFENHAADARVERQTGEFAAQRSECIAVVHRAQLGEQLVAIGNGLGGRRLDERKLLDRIQPQRLHAQDHGR